MLQPSSPTTPAADSTTSGGQSDIATPPSVVEDVEPTAAVLKPKRKRLTLQERLALAAKGKKKTDGSDASVSRDATPELANPVTHAPADAAVQSDAPNDVDLVDESISVHTSTVNSPEPAAKLAHQTAEYEALKQKYDQLNQKLAKLSNKELMAKIEKQNVTIDQLRQEGEALSHKELKLNETIKKLRAHSSNLEASLRDYANKDEESSEKMSHVNQVLKANLVKTIDQWVEKYNDMHKNFEETTKALAEVKEQHWEDKYKELQHLYENELWEKKQALKDLSDITLQYDMAKKQHELDSESKNTIIADLRREIQGKKKEKTEEVSRLERKIELLRLQSEGGYRVEQEDSPQAKQIDYAEYLKLSDNHHNLQQQYLSSQENWKLIESNLVGKIDTLTTSIGSLKKAKSKLSSDIKVLQGNLSRNSDELEAAQVEAKKTRSIIDDLTFQVQMKDEQIAELEDKLEKIQDIHNEERTGLMQKITKLTETIESKKRDVDSPRTTSQILEQRPAFSSHSNSWPEIRFGESSTTPSMSRHPSLMFIHQNPSLTSFGDAEDTFDDTSLAGIEPGQSSASNSGALPALSLTMSSGNNIQLINNMSSTIRRLEVELVTINEESAQVNEEKEQLQQELLSKIKLATENQTLKDEIADLQLQLADKEKQAQTMLELIGEKLEQVAELQADVVDLKDLLKLQVQQMMEMQGK